MLATDITDMCAVAILTCNRFVFLLCVMVMQVLFDGNVDNSGKAVKAGE